MDHRCDVKSKFQRTIDVVNKGADVKFQSLVRDPRVLAFTAASLNYFSRARLESQKLQTEIKSLKARVEVRIRLL